MDYDKYNTNGYHKLYREYSTGYQINIVASREKYSSR